MVHKKKSLGKLNLLFGLLFCLFLGFSSTTCYASISRDFLDYSIDYLYSTRSNHAFSYTDTQLAVFENFKNSDSLKNQFINLIDTKLTSQNLINLTDVNCLICAYRPSGSYLGFSLIFSNAGAPQGYQNLGFLKIYRDSDNLCFNCDGTSSDFIYYILIDVGESSCRINYSDKIYPGGYSGNIDYSYINFNFDNITFNDNHTIIYIDNIVACAYLPSVYGSYPFVDNATFYPMILEDGNGNYGNSSPEPDEPSGDSGGGTTPSGDSPSGDDGGSTSTPDYTNQLNTINSSINNVNNSVQDVKNQISGDTKKITNSIDNINNTLTEQPNLNNTKITSGDIERCIRF